MSDYQVVIGTFSKSKVAIGQDEDMHESGDRLKLNVVKADGQIYEFDILESFFLSLPIEGTDDHDG